MNLHSIRWRLPLSYAAIALLAALSLGSVMLLVLNGFYTGMEREYLASNAQALQPIVEKILRSGVPPQVLQDQIKGMSFLLQAQIRVLDINDQPMADSGVPNADQVVAVSGAPAGAVMFSVPAEAPMGETVTGFYINGDPVMGAQLQTFNDGGLPPKRMNTVINVRAAPLGGYGFVSGKIPSADRRSSQVVTLPLGGLLGSLEISHGPAYGSDILRSVALAWLFAGVLSILLAALAGWIASKQVTSPILALTEVAHRMENGNLSARATLPGEKQQEFTALAHAFNGMAGQVENTVSTLRAFVSDAAHELNTPLTALKTNLELAAAEPDAARRQDFLSHALEQNQRLEQLTSSLLDLSRIEASDAASTFEVIDLRQFTAQIGERFASRADQADRNFNLSLPENEVKIRGNATQLELVVGNLLENALKFTPENGTIHLLLETTEKTAILAITDTGIGIPPEDIPHLFERFHRGRNSSAYPGNGLGLAIAKAAVSAHAGSIQVKSEAGKGTSMFIHLPLVK